MGRDQYGNKVQMKDPNTYVFYTNGSSNGDNNSLPGGFPNAGYIYNGSTWDRIRSPFGAGADNNLGKGFIAQVPYLWNGSYYDRFYNNTQGTLLASAARAVSAVSPIQTNYNGKGVKLFLKVTNASGTGGLTVRLESIDPVSGDYAVELTAQTAIIANGLYEYDLYPGAAAAGNASPNAVNQRVQGILGRTWQARVNHGDGSSYTYSLGYELVL